MKTLHLLLVGFGFLASATGAFAQTPHYSASFTAAVTTQVTVTGTSGTVTTKIVNNARIFSAVLASNPGLTARDLDLVLDPYYTTLTVINKTTTPPTPLYTVMSGTGNSFALNGIVYAGKGSKVLSVSNGSGVSITLPNEQPDTANITTSYIFDSLTGGDENASGPFTITFAGSSGEGVGANLVTGVIRKGRAVYNYSP